MHSDDDDDLSEFRQPVPADDRLWRHPSELGSGASMPFSTGHGRLPQPPPPPARHRRRRSLAGVAAVAGLIGATTAVGAVVLAGGLRPRVIERGLGTTPASASSPSTVSTGDLSAMVATLQRSVVRVEATDEGVTRQGAAVVVTEDLLVTSARLVAGTPTITIRATDALVHEATVLGIDSTSGIAVLEVEGADLVPAPAAPLRPEAGDTAVIMSVGAGGDPVVSQGIVSSVGDTPDGSMRDLIIIDRPVSDSSDGGALLDGKGKVLGVCLVMAETSEQLGHAVPIEVARKVATDLRDGGAVQHAWLGVQGVDLPDKAALDLGLSGGGLLTEVTSGGPGERGGLRVGDVVIRMSGREVESINDLAVAIRDADPGEEAEIIFLRDGKRHSITVQLGNVPT